MQAAGQVVDNGHRVTRGRVGATTRRCTARSSSWTTSGNWDGAVEAATHRGATTAPPPRWTRSTRSAAGRSSTRRPRRPPTTLRSGRTFALVLTLVDPAARPARGGARAPGASTSDARSTHEDASAPGRRGRGRAPGRLRWLRRHRGPGAGRGGRAVAAGAGRAAVAAATRPGPTRPTARVDELARRRRSQQLRQRDRLVVGVSADTYLLGSSNPFTGEIEGFDIDLVEAIADAIFGHDDQGPRAAAGDHGGRPDPAAAGRATSTSWRAT